MSTRKLGFEALETRNLLSADVGFFAVPEVMDKSPPVTLQWQAQVGGSSYEEARSMVESPDGGYVAVGWTNSVGAGGEDAYAVKVDRRGQVEWTRTFGGAELDRAYSIHAVSSGGYVLAGRTRSDRLTANLESAYLIRISEQGDLLWEKTFGNRRANGARFVEQTQDGGFIISGWTSYQRHSNYTDVYVAKTDADGDLEWERRYRRKSWQGAQEIQQTSDGGYVLCGISRPSDKERLSGYMMKLDQSGTIQWRRIVGTRWGWDELYKVDETPEGDFVFAGGTQRRIGGEVRMRTWIIKTDPDGRILWNRWYGGGFGYIWGSTLTADGGVAVVGKTSDSADIALLKVDADGQRQWGMKFGSENNGQRYFDGGRSVVATSDGGFAFVGFLGKELGPKPKSKVQFDWDRDFWFVKLKPVTPRLPWPRVRALARL